MVKKKAKAEKAVVVAGVAAVATAPVVKVTKKEPYSLYAWFAYIDKEGFKVKSEYRSEGDSVDELLENLKDFPVGVNRLVNVLVKHGDKELERALAPHKARSILEKKNVADFNAVFRGL